MTLNTLWFNKGIFKNTLKRFKWGSFLYFIVLFFSVPFVLLTDDVERLWERYGEFITDSPILLRNDYFLIPLLLAVVVPTVVAVLIFNNVHSGKQSIFVHGLPVNRRANFISNIIAAFLLMTLPVLLNGGILLVMSSTAYGQVISSWSVIYWTCISLSILFIMFSIAVFSAFLTGNAAAHIVINVFLHVIPLLIALAITLISEIFLFGFVQSESFVANEIMNNTPIVWLFGRGMSHYRNELNMFVEPQMWAYLIGAVAVYGISFWLYNKRKIEAAGDVAAFKVFNPILKYAVSGAATVSVFGILTSINMEAVYMYIVVAVITAIIYFACEMLMRKSFKVFYTYKGYIGFVVFCAVFIGFFAYTGVFGYEKRIPDLDDIESAAVFQSWAEKPVSVDRGLIEETRKIHQKLISDIPVTVDEDEIEYRNLRVSYKLKNGRWLERYYKVSPEVTIDAMNKMYEFDEYKLKATEIDNLNIENIKQLTLRVNTNNFNYDFAVNEDSSKLIEKIEEDVKNLSYKEIQETHPLMNVTVSVGCENRFNKSAKIFKRLQGNESEYGYTDFTIDINPSFRNTYAFLKENGYYEQLIKSVAQNLYICKKPISRDGEIYNYKGQSGDFTEFMVSYNDCERISLDDAMKVVELMSEVTERKIREGSNYLLFNASQNNKDVLFAHWSCIAFDEDDLPEYLKKYIER